MKNNFTTVIFTILLCLELCSCAKFSVTKITKCDTLSKSGLAYILPKAVISTQIVTKETTIEKGVCYDYAIDKDDPICKNRTSGDNALIKLNSIDNKLATSYKVLKDKFAVSVRAIPDYDKHYFIKLKKNIAIDQTFSTKLNEIGLITEASYLQESKAFEIITQVAKSAFSLAGVGVKDADPSKDNYCSRIYKDLSGIREDKRKLISGNNGGLLGGNNNEKIFDKQLDLLNEAEADIVSQLSYSINNEITIFTIDIDIEKLKDGKSQNYFYVKNEKIHINKDLVLTEGLKQTDGIVLEDFGKIHKEDFYSIQMGDFYGNRNHVDNNFIPPKCNKGFAYNVPVAQRIIISHENINQVNERVEIPQWGKIAYLGNNLPKVSWTLNPTSGALLTVDATVSKAIDPSKISTVEGLLSSLKKEPAETDEEKEANEAKKKIDKLTSKKTILTLEAEIKKLENGKN